MKGDKKSAEHRRILVNIQSNRNQIRYNQMPIFMINKILLKNTRFEQFISKVTELLDQSQVDLIREKYGLTNDVTSGLNEYFQSCDKKFKDF